MSGFKSIYGIHSFALLNKDTLIPYVLMKAIGSANLELSGESQKLTGGSSPYPLDSEVSSISSECSFTAREYPATTIEKFLAASLTTYAPVSAGQIVEKANLVGDSGDDLTVGLASGASADLKAGMYVFKFTDTAKGILYAMSDIAGGTFEDEDALQVTEELTLSSSPTTVTGYGITLTAPATPAFVADDAVKFTVVEPDKTLEVITVGKLSASFEEFAAVIYAQKRGSSTYTWMFLSRVKAYGMPVQFEEKKFSEWQVKLEVLYDPDNDKVFDIVRQY